MPLTLALRERSRFYVGGRKWRVRRVEPKRVEIVGPDEQRVIVTDEETTEIEPNVRVSVGHEVAQPHTCRLVFDAPRSVRILREELKESG
jgi:hypothetical protein